uniref:Glycoprotein n=1 Tax=Pond slider nidovirus TaxID=2961778 RepID=A0A9N6YK84_9NIDO|nr:TPA_asm: hypothetical protein [Pond slider nidovirus]
MGYCDSMVAKTLVGNFITSDGSSFRVEVRYSYIREITGKLVHFLCVLLVGFIFVILIKWHVFILMFMVINVSNVSAGCSVITQGALFNTTSCASHSHYHLRGSYLRCANTTSDLTCVTYVHNTTIVTTTCCNTSHSSSYSFEHSYYNGTELHELQNCSGEILGYFCSVECWQISKLSNGTHCKTVVDKGRMCTSQRAIYKVPLHHQDVSQVEIISSRPLYEVSTVDVTKVEIEDVENSIEEASERAKEFIERALSLNVSDVFSNLMQLSPYWLAAVYSSAGFARANGQLPMYVNVTKKEIVVVNCLTSAYDYETSVVCSNNQLYLCITPCYVVNMTGALYVSNTKLHPIGECSGTNITLKNDTIVGDVHIVKHSFSTHGDRPRTLKILDYVLDHSAESILIVILFYVLIFIVSVVYISIVKLVNGVNLIFRVSRPKKPAEVATKPPSKTAFPEHVQ